MPAPELPTRLDTPRLIIRCWDQDDAALLRDAIHSSLEHLRRWMPWAMEEPSSLEETIERLRGYRARFEAGEDYVYGLFSRDQSEVVGGSGLHPRIGQGGLEIGYWVRASRAGRGYATEAVKALTDAGLGVSGVNRLQIMCDPDNTASRRVAEKLGYELVETRVKDTRTPAGAPRNTLVFEMRSD